MRRCRHVRCSAPAVRAYDLCDIHGDELGVLVRMLAEMAVWDTDPLSAAGAL